MRHRLALLATLTICKLLLQLCTLPCSAQTVQDSAETRVINTRLDALQHEVEQHRQEIDRKIEMSQDQIRTFVILLGVVSSLGSVVGGAFAFTSWYAGRRDYQNERKFYETRMTELDKKQGTLAEQQISLGANIVAKSDQMLTQQIDTILKLGGVIEVVRKSFELQIAREDSLKNVTEIVESLNSHFTEAYASAKRRISSLGISRMDWASMSAYQSAIAAGARAEFQLVPDTVLKKELDKDACDVARVCQLLGTSALYANDIVLAERLLNRSRDIYKATKDTTGHTDPMAAASLFLGLSAGIRFEPHFRLLS